MNSGWGALLTVVLATLVLGTIGYLTFLFLMRGQR